MAKNLVIVESPAKAKTIEKFLGSDYEVRASMGHIIDLPLKGLGVDVKHDFAPNYAIIERKENLIKELRAASKKAETVYLAPDPDREGEFIAWALKKELDLKSPKRAVFNEITKRAVQDAIAHPREIDENLFNAQQARRVLDRLVGYKISPLLWRRVQSNTSAGRVQSVALRLIVERENEIRAFTPEEYWTITASLAKPEGVQVFTAQLVARLDDKAATTPSEEEAAEENPQQREARERDRALKLHVTSEAEAQAILAQLQGATYKVRGVTQRDVRRQPYLPYTTSTMQQDASVRLRFKPKRTMALAQELYEGIELGDRGHQGLITYMRTDSTRISAEAQTAVKAYISGRWGKDYVGPGRTAKAKAGQNVQDAHEAIRPTDPNLTPESVKSALTPDQYKLYQAIWRRFVASFMAPAVFDTLRVDISAADYLFRANGSIMKFAGFYAVWPHDEDNDLLPPLAVGDLLDLRKMDPKQHFTQPPPRFTEASLIKELEEKGIGRPSTYVPIVSTIQDRGYVEQQERRFVPTWLGETVNELMVKHFPEIVDSNFTADMERRLDAVEEGSTAWTAFLKDFYDRLKTTLGVAEKEMDFVKKPTEDLGEPCPTCGKPLLIRQGRFGRFISCSGYPDCDYKAQLLNKVGVKCPVDGGELVERKSRGRGKIFFGCANYPNCNYATWNKPIALPCPEDGGLLTVGNGARVAVCQKCGAEVADFATSEPVVVGHRAVGEAAEKPKRVTRARKTMTTGEGEEAAASAAPRTRTTAATGAKSTTTRRTAASKSGATAKTRTTTKKTTTTKKEPSAASTAKKPRNTVARKLAASQADADIAPATEE
ncbi:MAG: type I DNA topoisomerase [Ktedonobacterales bacterium]|nr:type I DNA topoisomerase [Ktedonobacterales bacterium]